LYPSRSGSNFTEAMKFSSHEKFLSLQKIPWHMNYSTAQVAMKL